MSMAGKKFNFEKAQGELEAIVAELEGREINLETDLPKFERGMELAHRLAAALAQAENKVEEISVKYGEEKL